MTNADAIENLNKLTLCNGWSECYFECDACDLAVKVEDALETYSMAIEALTAEDKEYRTAKTPVEIRYFDGYKTQIYGIGKCPRCEMLNDSRENTRYCGWCGQRISWKNTEVKE